MVGLCLQIRSKSGIERLVFVYCVQYWHLAVAQAKVKIQTSTRVFNCTHLWAVFQCVYAQSIKNFFSRNVLVVYWTKLCVFLLNTHRNIQLLPRFSLEKLSAGSARSWPGSGMLTRMLTANTGYGPLNGSIQPFCDKLLIGFDFG